MAAVHDLLATRGKQGAVEAGFDRSVIEVAAAYLSDEDSGLGFAYSCSRAANSGCRRGAAPPRRPSTRRARSARLTSSSSATPRPPRRHPQGKPNARLAAGFQQSSVLG